METNSPSAVLYRTIHQLEAQKAYEEQLLIEQCSYTFERLKTVNLLKNTIREAISSPNLLDEMLGAAVGLVSGYLTKKAVTGVSGNIFRKLMGFLMQLGVTNAVAHHPQEIKSVGQYLFHHFFQKNKEKQRPR